jgi:predicted site-specific integrase-resolvase
MSTTPARLTTKRQAADLYGVSESTVHNWIRKNYLTPYRARGVRGLLVDCDEIDRMLAKMPPSRVHAARGGLQAKAVRVEVAR